MRTGRPARVKIEPGQIFGKLTTIALNGQDRHGRKLWDCQCECGKVANVKATYLSNGVTKSCGCEKYSGLGQSRHGHKPEHKASQVYKCWTNMKSRCTNPKATGFHRYGGRGIKICDRWMESFENFLADMGEPPTPAHSIERKDNDGNYEPGNCIWADRLAQRLNNTCPTRWITINGERMILKEAVERFSPVKYGIVASRLHRGWNEMEAIMTPTSSKWSRRSKE